MPSLVTVTEVLNVPPNTMASAQAKQQALLKSGAVTCNIDSSDPTKFVLTIQFNVWGENGPTLVAGTS